MGLVDAVGARTVATDFDSVALLDSGSIVDEDTYRLTEGAGSDASVAGALAELVDLDDPFMQWCVAATITAEYAELSLRWFGHEDELYGPDLILPAGYAQLVNHLADGLAVTLGAEVTRIAYDSSGVRVETSQGAVAADRVIVTVPLGVLKAGAIEFDPPLPEPKLGAIERLGFGLLDKVALVFDEPFWPQEPDMFGIVGRDQPVSDLVNGMRFTDRPVLVGLRGGANALRRERDSDTTTVSEVLATLSAPQPAGALVTRWAADPYARGSYSFLAVGSSPEDQRVLAEPVGQRVSFAGEATHEQFFATVHGAYLSGLREADRILG